MGKLLRLVHKCIARRSDAKRSWLIQAMRLIRCTIDPQINHKARINHVKVTMIVLVS